jgi:hypothetical protein
VDPGLAVDLVHDNPPFQPQDPDQPHGPAAYGVDAAIMQFQRHER